MCVSKYMFIGLILFPVSDSTHGLLQMVSDKVPSNLSNLSAKCIMIVWGKKKIRSPNTFLLPHTLRSAHLHPAGGPSEPWMHISRTL